VLLSGSIHTIKKNTEVLVGASKEIGLEANAEKIKYMVMSRDQNARQNHNIKTDNKFFERVEQFKYLGTILTHQNSIQEQIKSTLKSGNACYHSVQDLPSSSLLSKNTEIKIYRTIISPFVLYACETWSLTLREEHRLRVFENRVLRRIFGAKRDEVAGECRRLQNEERNDLYSSPTIIRVIKSRRMRWAGHVARMGRRGEVHTGFYWGNLREGDYLEDPGVDGRIILKLIFKKRDGWTWTGLIWLRIGTGGGLL
jgi:hypothetical protein